MTRPHRRAFADAMQSLLDPGTIEIFELLRVERDPAWTIEPDALRSLLETRGLPAHASALAIEHVAGGAEIRPGVHLGAFASLRRLDGRRPALPGDPNWTAPRTVPETPRAALVPIVVHRWGEPWPHEASVDAEGVIHLVNGDDDYGYASPAFDTFAQYMEIFALLRETIVWPPDAEGLPWHRIQVDALAGEALSAAIGAAPFPRGSGARCEAWRSGALHVVELRVDGFANDTRVGTPDIDEAIAALRAALDVSSDVVWWSPSPLGGAITKLPRPTSHERSGGCEVVVWGSPNSFGFEQRRAHAEALRRST